jgi:lysophospholipase L1-like esterase
MIGINDINLGYSTNEILNNYMDIIQKIQKNGTNIYIQSTLECAESICGSALTKIKILNERLEIYANKNQLPYININEELADESRGLNLEYSPDGVHLLGKGYQMWSKKIIAQVVSE